MNMNNDDNGNPNENSKKSGSVSLDNFWQQNEGSNFGIYSMMNEDIGESSVDELEDLFSTAVGDIPSQNNFSAAIASAIAVVPQNQVIRNDNDSGSSSKPIVTAINNSSNTRPRKKKKRKFPSTTTTTTTTATNNVTNGRSSKNASIVTSTNSSNKVVKKQKIENLSKKMNIKSKKKSLNVSPTVTVDGASTMIEDKDNNNNNNINNHNSAFAKVTGQQAIKKGKKKSYYKQKSFVYNGTRCRFPINSDDDLLLDPVVWYRACIDFQRAGILSELKLTKINHESQFPEDAYHLPLSFEKRQDLTPLYRRFYSALPLSGVIKLCIYRYLVDLLMAKKVQRLKTKLDRVHLEHWIDVDNRAQEAVAFLFRHDLENHPWANSSSIPITPDPVTLTSLDLRLGSLGFTPALRPMENADKYYISNFQDKRPTFSGNTHGGASSVSRARLKLSPYGKFELKLNATTFQPTLHSELIYYLKNSVDMSELQPAFTRGVGYITAGPTKRGRKFYIEKNHEPTKYRQTLAHWHIDSQDNYLDSLRRKICSHLSGHICSCAVFAMKQKWGDAYFEAKMMEIEVFLDL